MAVLSTLGKIVTVVNRVVDENGKRVPHEAYLDGDAFKIEDFIQLPAGLARIVVHNSMYMIDPVTHMGQYKLSVKEWGMPTDDLPLAEVQRLELVDRDLLPEHRHLGAVDKTGRKLKPVRIHNPVRRHDPLAQNAPGPRDDGAHPGGFGEAFTR